MPLTFPSHAAAVLPIKLAWPYRWDGVALVIGSTAPDWPYAVSPYVYLDAHNWAALFWFCLPVTLAGTWIARRAAPTVAAHLPNAFHDYGVLGGVRYRWWVTAGSALVGSFTHIAWDSFTHERATGIWTFLHLDRIAFGTLPWWHLLQFTSTVVGAIVTTVIAWHISRGRLLVAWHGPPPAMVVQPVVFWSVALAVAIVGLAMLPMLGAAWKLNVLGVRLLIIVAVALLAGAYATSMVRRNGDRHATGPTRLDRSRTRMPPGR